MTNPSHEQTFALDTVEHYTAQLARARAGWEAAILDAAEQGWGVRSIAERAGCSPMTVVNVCRRLEAQR